METFHGNLRPDQIMISREGVFKMGSIIYADDYLKKSKQDIQSSKALYLSPAIYSCLKNNTTPVDIERFKGDVFALGLIILEAGLLRNIQSVFEDPYIVDRHNLESLIAEFSDKNQVNPLLVSSVQNMLKISDKTRPDFQKLQERSSPYDQIVDFFRNSSRTGALPRNTNEKSNNSQ